MKNVTFRGEQVKPNLKELMDLAETKEEREGIARMVEMALTLKQMLYMIEIFETHGKLYKQVHRDPKG